MLFHKKKKQEQTEPAYPHGFSMDAPATSCSGRTFVCAMKGLLIFAASYGAIGAVISSFSLPCYPVAVFVCFLLFSMLLAFLHYSRFIFNLFYPVIFLVFSYSIFTYRYQVNSGYQAFMAILQEAYSDYFDLSILREAKEYYADRTLTITFAAIFIGFFLIVLLNICISEYMNLFFVFLLTFPIFQLGIYIDKMPALPYFVLLLFSYFMIFLLKQSRHFKLPYRDKKWTEFAAQQKGKQLTFRYHASGRLFFQLSVLLFAFTCLAGLFCIPFLSASSTKSTSRLRTGVDASIKILTQSGIGGFFDRYSATGGISEGKLGGVSSVRPDYKTDLTITFVPFSYETLYLRAYVGETYTGSSWEAPSFDRRIFERAFGEHLDDYEEYTAFLEARRLQHYTNTTKNAGIYGKMQIENVDANPNCLYLPYYTINSLSVPYQTTDSIVRGQLAKGSAMTLSYYPLLHNYWNIPAQPDALLNDLSGTDTLASYIEYYDTFCLDHYLDYPDDLQDYFSQLREEIVQGETLPRQIELVQNYLTDNYSYSMTPGSTPVRKDFVSYFLQEQKEGYCAHFASAATLLLRSYGIPARYVEGYAVSVSDVSEGSTLQNETTSDWFNGKNPIGDTGVVSVNVTDADAHAWVEVYQKGIGWVPYEFTPASSGSEGDDSSTLYSDFWSLFVGIFSPDQTTGMQQSGQTTDASHNSITARLKNSSYLMPLFAFAVIILLLLLIFVPGRLLYLHYTAYRKYQKGDYMPLLLLHYHRICRLFSGQGKEAAGLLPQNMLDLLEKCCFSQNGITKKEADKLLLFLKQYKRNHR